MNNPLTTLKGKFSNLRLSISNLFDEFGSTNNLIVGTVINLATVAVGLTIWLATTPPLSYVGLFVAVLGAWPLAQYILWGDQA